MVARGVKNKAKKVFLDSQAVKRDRERCQGIWVEVPKDDEKERSSPRISATRRTSLMPALFSVTREPSPRNF